MSHTRLSWTYVECAQAKAMELSFIVIGALFMSCHHKDAWADVPTECVSPVRSVGSIESYVIEGKSRGIQYRLVPDVLGGSPLIERRGRLVPERNEIGVVEIAVTERPSDGSVQVAYTQAMPDGGWQEVSEVFRCHPLVPK